MPSASAVGPAMDPIRDRLQRRRISLGLTFQAIAVRAGLRSASYVFHIENGQRVPSEAVAARLACALGEDERAFAAWARALQRADLRTVLDATRELLEDPELAAFAAGTWTPRMAEPERAARALSDAPASVASASFARLRIPVLETGDDPGAALKPACPVLRTLSLDARVLGDPETFVRPFAYVLGSEAAHRVPELEPGRIVILSRASGALDPGSTYAVRHGGRIELARLLWNGRELLVLPAPGASDFLVLPARDIEAMRACIAGRVARVLHPAQIS